MPSKPLRPCSRPGCPNLTTKRFCPIHAKAERKRYDQQRGTSSQRGYGYRWQQYRLRFLQRNPLCVECVKEGRYEPAKHVDHIIAVSGPDDPLFWEPNNHQGLCHSHHSVKTVKQDGGFGR